MHIGAKIINNSGKKSSTKTGEIVKQGFLLFVAWKKGKDNFRCDLYLAKTEDCPRLSFLSKYKCAIKFNF